jgi:hypothetical protein
MKFTFGISLGPGCEKRTIAIIATAMTTREMSMMAPTISDTAVSLSRFSEGNWCRIVLS